MKIKNVLIIFRKNSKEHLDISQQFFVIFSYAISFKA